MLNNDEELKQLETISQKMQNAGGISWAALVRNEDGSLEEVIRTNRPCYGEMRRYHDGNRPDDHHPHDIPKVIPFGTREAISVSLPDLGNIAEGNRLTEFVFSKKDSPWRNGLGSDVTLTKNKAGRYNSVYMTDTDFDPTVFVNLLITFRNLQRTYYTIPLEEAEAAGLTFNQAFIARVFGAKPVGFNQGMQSTSYYLSENLNLDRFINGDTHDLSTGRTWREQDDYNRPDIHLIFGGRSDLPGYFDKSIRSWLQRPLDVPAEEYTVDNVLANTKAMCNEFNIN